MNKQILLSIFTLLCATSAYSQSDDGELKVGVSGRILLDAATMSSSNDALDEELDGGFVIADARLGIKASYNNWQAKVDVGYSKKTFSMKDVYLEYSMNDNSSLRLGYFRHQFGYQSATSSSDKPMMEPPSMYKALGSSSRLLGLMYQYSTDLFFGSFSVYSDNQSVKTSTKPNAYQGNGLMTRLVIRPSIKQGSILQFGVGASYDHKTKNETKMEWDARYPTRVSNVDMLGVELSDAISSLRFTEELAMASGSFAFEAQHIFMIANRKYSMPDYNAWGAWVNLRFLLNGSYAYNKGKAVIKNPSKGNVELVASYDYTDMNDDEYRGGKASDFSLTMNYYINKYMTWRISCHNVYVGSSPKAGFDKNHFHVLQTRLQIKF